MCGNVEDPQIAWSSLQKYDYGHNTTTTTNDSTILYTTIFNLSIHYVPQASRVSYEKHHENVKCVCHFKMQYIGKIFVTINLTNTAKN